MVPQIIYIILQVFGLTINFVQFAKKNNWKGFFWYMIGVIFVYLLLISGGFFNPLIQNHP